MGGAEIWLELALTGLLAATLLQAIRLQRAIRSLRTERDSLDDAVAGFDSGTRKAEAGLARLHDAAQRLTGDMSQALSLKEDLCLLVDRGAQVADRLEALVRATRRLETVPASRSAAAMPNGAATPVRSQAERDLLMALQAAR
jgi:exonuclease VII small subunit